MRRKTCKIKTERAKHTREQACEHAREQACERVNMQADVKRISGTINETIRETANKMNRWNRRGIYLNQPRTI